MVRILPLMRHWVVMKVRIPTKSIILVILLLMNKVRWLVGHMGRLLVVRNRVVAAWLVDLLLEFLLNVIHHVRFIPLGVRLSERIHSILLLVVEERRRLGHLRERFFILLPRIEICNLPFEVCTTAPERLVVSSASSTSSGSSPSSERLTSRRFCLGFFHLDWNNFSLIPADLWSYFAHLIQ